MPTYHYINTDHTLAFRDNHCIAWDAQTDRPAAVQHASTEDELALWRAAGSPRPTIIERRFQLPPGIPPERLEIIEQSRDMQTLANIIAAEDIKNAASQASDVGTLKVQVQALAELVRTLFRSGRHP